MEPIEIRILLLRAGKTQGQIARELGITRAFVNQVVFGRRPTRYIREAIAKSVGKRVDDIWPEKNSKRKAA